MSISPLLDFPAALSMLAVVTFAGFLVRAAVEDLFERRIPNLVCAGVVLCFFLHAWATPQPVDWLGSFSVAAMAFCLGAFLFARGAMGGGDVKLMTACGLWCGFELSVVFGLVVSLTGGVLAVVYLLMASLPLAKGAPQPPTMPQRPAAWPDQNKKASCDDLPYGIAIAAGGGWVATELFLRNITIMEGIS